MATTSSNCRRGPSPGVTGVAKGRRIFSAVNVTRSPLVRAAHQSNPGSTYTGCAVGDLGYLDEEGYMYLTDRAAFMIITGGENVYPFEVENALIAHPDIRDAAVVGHEDPDLGQRVVAFVEPIRPVENEVAWVESVNRYLREHLAGYKCPREIRLVDQLPRTPTGKVMKRDL